MSENKEKIYDRGRGGSSDVHKEEPSNTHKEDCGLQTEGKSKSEIDPKPGPSGIGHVRDIDAQPCGSQAFRGRARERYPGRVVCTSSSDDENIAESPSRDRLRDTKSSKYYEDLLCKYKSATPHRGFPKQLWQKRRELYDNTSSARASSLPSLFRGRTGPPPYIPSPERRCEASDDRNKAHNATEKDENCAIKDESRRSRTMQKGNNPEETESITWNNLERRIELEKRNQKRRVLDREDSLENQPSTSRGDTMINNNYFWDSPVGFSESDTDSPRGRIIKGLVARGQQDVLRRNKSNTNQSSAQSRYSKSPSPERQNKSCNLDENCSICNGTMTEEEYREYMDKLVDRDVKAGLIRMKLAQTRREFYNNRRNQQAYYYATPDPNLPSTSRDIPPQRPNTANPENNLYRKYKSLGMPPEAIYKDKDRLELVHRIESLWTIAKNAKQKQLREYRKKHSIPSPERPNESRNGNNTKERFLYHIHNYENEIQRKLTGHDDNEIEDDMVAMTVMYGTMSRVERVLLERRRDAGVSEVFRISDEILRTVAAYLEMYKAEDVIIENFYQLSAGDFKVDDELLHNIPIPNSSKAHANDSSNARMKGSTQSDYTQGRYRTDRYTNDHTTQSGTNARDFKENGLEDQPFTNSLFNNPAWLIRVHETLKKDEIQLNKYRTRGNPDILEVIQRNTHRIGGIYFVDDIARREEPCRAFTEGVPDWSIEDNRSFVHGLVAERFIRCNCSTRTESDGPLWFSLQYRALYKPLRRVGSDSLLRNNPYANTDSYNRAEESLNDTQSKDTTNGDKNDESDVPENGTTSKKRNKKLPKTEKHVENDNVHEGSNGGNINTNESDKRDADDHKKEGSGSRSRGETLSNRKYAEDAFKRDARKGRFDDFSNGRESSDENDTRSLRYANHMEDVTTGGDTLEEEDMYVVRKKSAGGFEHDDYPTASSVQTGIAFERRDIPCCSYRNVHDCSIGSGTSGVRYERFRSIHPTDRQVDGPRALSAGRASGRGRSVGHKRDMFLNNRQEGSDSSDESTSSDDEWRNKSESVADSAAMKYKRRFLRREQKMSELSDTSSLGYRRPVREHYNRSCGKDNPVCALCNPRGAHHDEGRQGPDGEDEGMNNEGRFPQNHRQLGVGMEESNDEAVKPPTESENEGDDDQEDVNTLLSQDSLEGENEGDDADDDDQSYEIDFSESSSAVDADSVISSSDDDDDDDDGHNGDDGCCAENNMIEHAKSFEPLALGPAPGVPPEFRSLDEMPPFYHCNIGPMIGAGTSREGNEDKSGNGVAHYGGPGNDEPSTSSGFAASLDRTSKPFKMVEDVQKLTRLTSRESFGSIASRESSGNDFDDSSDENKERKADDREENVVVVRPSASSPNLGSSTAVEAPRAGRRNRSTSRPRGDGARTSKSLTKLSALRSGPSLDFGWNTEAPQSDDDTEEEGGGGEDQPQDDWASWEEDGEEYQNEVSAQAVGDPNQELPADELAYYNNDGHVFDDDAPGDVDFGDDGMAFMNVSRHASFEDVNMEWPSDEEAPLPPRPPCQCNVPSARPSRSLPATLDPPLFWRGGRRNNFIPYQQTDTAFVLYVNEEDMSAYRWFPQVRDYFEEQHLPPRGTPVQENALIGPRFSSSTNHRQLCRVNSASSFLNSLGERADWPEPSRDVVRAVSCPTLNQPDEAEKDETPAEQAETADGNEAGPSKSFKARLMEAVQQVFDIRASGSGSKPTHSDFTMLCPLSESSSSEGLTE